MKKNKVSINIISSFNDANFIGLLKNSQDFDWKVNQVDYNQVFQTLTDPQKKIWKEKANVTLIWTTLLTLFPEGLVNIRSVSYCQNHSWILMARARKGSPVEKHRYLAQKNWKLNTEILLRKRWPIEERKSSNR